MDTDDEPAVDVAAAETRTPARPFIRYPIKEEDHGTAGLIVSSDVLSVFPPDDVRAKYDAYCDKLNRDFDFGKVEAIAAIGKLKSKPDLAH